MRIFADIINHVLSSANSLLVIYSPENAIARDFAFFTSCLKLAEFCDPQADCFVISGLRDGSNLPENDLLLVDTNLELVKVFSAYPITC